MRINVSLNIYYYLCFLYDNTYCHFFGVYHRLTKRDYRKLRIWFYLLFFTHTTLLWGLMSYVTYLMSLIILCFIKNRVEKKYEHKRSPMNVIQTRRIDYESSDVSYTVITGEWRGRREYMEDRILDMTNHQIYGVFDGHGGSDVADHLLTNFESVYSSISDKISNTSRVLTDTFYRLEEEIEESNLKGGSTGTVVKIEPSLLQTVSIGDSEAWVLTDNQKTVRLNKLHSFGTYDEYYRYVRGLAFEGEVDSLKRSNVIRTKTGLMPTRSFGDLNHKRNDKLLLSAPDTTEIEFTEGDWEIIVIGADGLFDGMNMWQIIEEMERTGVRSDLNKYNVSKIEITNLIKRLHEITTRIPNTYDKIRGFYGGDNCSICLIIRGDLIEKTDEWNSDQANVV